MCETPVLEGDEGFNCPKCHTEFSQVGESAYLIKHVGHVSISDLREAMQCMIGSYQSTLNI